MAFGFAPEARVLHNQGASTGSGQSVRTRPRLPIYLDERNKMLVTRDCFAGRLPIAAVAALGLLALRFLRRGAWKQFGYGLAGWRDGLANRSEEHTSELQSLMRISYAVFCLKKKKKIQK